MSVMTPHYLVRHIDELTPAHLRLIIPNCRVLRWDTQGEDTFLKLSTDVKQAVCISSILIEEELGAYVFHVKYELRDTLNGYQSEGKFSFSLKEKLPSTVIRKLCAYLNEMIWENSSGYQEHLSKIEERAKLKKERSGLFGFFRFSSENSGTRLKALEKVISRLERDASEKRR
jgi:hypothetical protein